MITRDRIKELRRVPASELIPNARNWREHPPAQRAAVAAVLKEIGNVDAIIARELPDGRLEIIDGHLRQSIRKDETVAVLVVDLDEAEALKVLATFDPLSAMATTDKNQLEALLAEVHTSDEALQAMLDELATDAGLMQPPEVVEDEVPEPPKVARTKTGDLYQLGEHRVLCGDSTKADDVARVMGGGICRLIATDPPYGVDFVGARYCPTAKDWDGIQNDHRQGVVLKEWLAGMWTQWLQHCSRDASFYSWAAAMEEGAAAAAMRDAGIHVQSQIIWAKNSLVLGQSDYQWKHENCWYGYLKGKKHRWYGGRSQTTVWEVSKVASASYVHPMQKPVELYAIPIRNHTKTNDVVGDPFLGSGSQLIAAEQLGRRCFGIEIDPIYVDVIVARWEKFTGRKAELIDG